MHFHLPTGMLVNRNYLRYLNRTSNLIWVHINFTRVQIAQKVGMI